MGLHDLADETILVAASRESGGLYPDLGLQAVRDGAGIVIYVRSAYPDDVPGSAFVPVEPALSLPFDLAFRPAATAATRMVVDVARGLS